jgi:hypothetical protein
MARPLLPSPLLAAFDAHLLARTFAIDALELPPLPSLGDFPPAARSEPMLRRAGCPSRACPDRWEPRGATPGATR